MASPEKAGKFFVIEQNALVNGFLCGFVKHYTADDELLADTVTAMLPDDPASLSTIRPRSLWHLDEDGNHCCLVGHDAFREAVKRAGATFEEVDSEFPRRWAKKNRGLVSGLDPDHANWNENQRRAQEALALDFIHSVEDEAS